jgi:hypothetical protein
MRNTRRSLMHSRRDRLRKVLRPQYRTTDHGIEVEEPDHEFSAGFIETR